MADVKISGLPASTTPLAGTEVLPIVQGTTTKQVSVANLTAGRSVSVASLGVGTASPASFVDIFSANQGYAGLSLQGFASATKWYVNAGISTVNINPFSISTNANGTSPALCIYASGGVSIGNTTDAGAGNLRVTGNVVIATSGKGIDFTATPGTGTSELLADYEEGTWTPTDASGAGLTITVANATYTKIGRLVTANFAVTYPATADVSTCRLAGLPFNSLGAAFSYPMAVSFSQSGICKTGLVDPGGTTFLLLDNSGTGLTNVQMSTLILRGTVVYEA
jgi:hypothetical protein